jgi:hypothetical protein
LLFFQGNAEKIALLQPAGGLLSQIGNLPFPYSRGTRYTENALND